jgi:hypothetical protein
VTIASLHLEPPVLSIRADWLGAAIHLTDQDFLGRRFAELPPEHDSSFSYAVRREVANWCWRSGVTAWRMEKLGA